MSVQKTASDFFDSMERKNSNEFTDQMPTDEDSLLSDGFNSNHCFFHEAMSVLEQHSNFKHIGNHKCETDFYKVLSFLRNVTVKTWTTERALEELGGDLRAESL